MTQEIMQENVTAGEPTCAHYWIIEAAGGPTSKGVCRLCGVVKEFMNYVEGGSWDDDRSSGRSQSRRRAPALAIAEDNDSSDDS